MEKPEIYEGVFAGICINDYQWMCFACGNSQNTIALTVRPTALHVQEARLQHQAAAAGAAAKPGSALAEVGMSICHSLQRMGPAMSRVS